MQFIIINNRYGKGLRLRLGPVTCVLLFGLVVGLVGGLFAGGVYFARAHNEDTLTSMYGAAGLAWQREIREQRATIDDARYQANQQINALAARVSKLQGHVLRLDALGERLANMAELDDFEFGVENPPGMGGPEPAFQHDMETADFIETLDRLSSDLDERADKLRAIEQLLLSRNLREQILPDGSPLRGGWISSWFGMRTNPISGRRELHEGIDFAGKPGSTVHAAAAGVVTWSGRRGGYGNMVEISHGDGYTTRYAHNKENLARVGQRVDKGDAIATLGSTGRSTGTHVHFEVLQDGKVVNPKNYISVN